MDWVVILLLAVVVMLWWIRAALEPIREYFAARNAATEEHAFEREMDEQEVRASGDGAGAGE